MFIPLCRYANALSPPTSKRTTNLADRLVFTYPIS